MEIDQILGDSCKGGLVPISPFGLEIRVYLMAAFVRQPRGDGSRHPLNILELIFVQG